MYRHRVLRVVAVVLLVVLPAMARAQSSVPVLSPGTHDQVLTRTSGGPIHFAISVPPGYHGEAVPMILALHFGGDPEGAGRAMLDILIQPALGSLNALIVAPDSLAGGWNSSVNQQAVEALLAAIESSYAVDRKKVIVAGYSMGGAGAWYWAGRDPNRFSAAIPVSGRPMPATAGWRVPVFAVHSRDDQTNPIGPTEQRIAELKQQGVNAQIVVLSGIAHYQTDRFVAGLRQAVPWLQKLWSATR